MTRASLRARLAPYYRRRGEVELDAAVDTVMARIARGPTRPDPPMGQPLEAVADPWMGSGTHPDIIAEMWSLDDALPVRCRWVFCGGPALVHPVSGVVFAVGFGTIGFVVRLPEAVRSAASPDPASAMVAGAPGRTFDISPAGPEWRFLRSQAPRQAWTRAAYDFAGEPR